MGRFAPEASVWLDVDRGLEAEAQGRFAAAITLLQGAADRAEANPALFTPIQRFRFREREARALMRATRFAECLAILEKLQPQEALLLGPSHPETLLTMKVRVSALSQSGRSGEALDLIDRSYPAFVAALGATNRDTIMMLANRTALERVLGRYDASVRDGLLLHQRIVDTQGPRAFYGFASLSDVALAQCRSGHAKLKRLLGRPGSPLVGYRYFKAGVILNDLVPAAEQPRMLFATRDPVRSAKVMAALDTVNAGYGRGTPRPLATGIARSWGTRHERLSPRYTTRLEEILVATAW